MTVDSLFTFFTALVISTAVIPLMIRVAPHIGMIDLPDARKVHASPTPRAGGIGIVVGTLIPILLWLPIDRTILAYVAGSIILLFFGAWDDIHALSARVKIIGQILAASVVVYYGRVYVATLPLMGLNSLPTVFAKPFTVFAIVGTINAMNVSDGLDGLAGGLSILSLCCIGYLAFQSQGLTAVAIAATTLGGVLGFMRYNTLPARVFMGDSGSQFLGFTLGFLAVFLVQQVNPALSPALPLLFLGLPIADLIAVIAQRLYLGISPFVATKHHVHHRLLGLGFDHYEAVVVIYALQSLLVVLALFMRYDMDGVILGAYFGICISLFLYLYLATRLGWHAHRTRVEPRLKRAIVAIRHHPLFTAVPVQIVTVAIPVLFLGVSLLCTRVPKDFAVGATALAALLALQLILARANGSLLLHAVSYVTAAFVIYLEGKYMGEQVLLFDYADIGYFVILAIAIGLAVRYAAKAEFKTTPMDYLVVLIVLSVGFLFRNNLTEAGIGAMVVKLMVVFYGCELIISRSRSRWNSLNISSLLTLSILGARGLGIG